LAESVTVLPAVKVLVQLFPQLIPAGTLVTLPVPPPTFTTVNAGEGSNVAVTD
jgi:hypothetical protein